MARDPSWRRVALFLLSVLSCLSMGFGPPVLIDADCASRRLTAHQVRAMREVSPPELTSPAFILADAVTGEILHARAEHERRPPASMTKIVTALVALERGRQDQEFTVQRRDLGVYSVLYLRAGEELTLRQLLFMLLISSDNVAAMVIARGLGGDVSTFVGWMNDYVAELGLEDTNFVNPHGYDHPDHYSTAFDMAIISLKAMENPIIADIVRRPEAIAAWRNLESTNDMLTTYAGTIGLKTGTTDLAGECLAVVVDRPAGRALTVVMGAEDRFYDTRLLMDYYYANFAELHIDLPETPQNRYLTQDYQWQPIRLAEPLTFLVSPWQLNTASLYRRISKISPDPDPAEPVGALVVTLAGEPFTEVPLYVRSPD